MRKPGAAPKGKDLVEATVVLEFPDKEKARVVASSIAVDNEGWVEQKLRANRIEASARGADLRSLRRTVDDWLAAATVAARAHGLAKGEEREEEA